MGSIDGVMHMERLGVQEGVPHYWPQDMATDIDDGDVSRWSFTPLLFVWGRHIHPQSTTPEPSMHLSAMARNV
jgi:hypothetical protein